MADICLWCLGKGVLEYGTGTETGNRTVRCGSCGGEGVHSVRVEAVLPQEEAFHAEIGAIYPVEAVLQSIKVYSSI
jgi:hypothetical protein